MIDEIIEIGKKLEKFEFESRLFTAKSKELIDQFEITKTLSEFSAELGQWITKSALPEQLNVYNTFGQPPVTVFRNENFVIDIYFWMHADTSLHSHAFCGSFKILYGQSLHEEFSIEQIKSYSHDASFNKLTRTDFKILNPSDSITILRGSEFNHRVVHLSTPSVTLCIRTVTDKEIPQWHHFDNGLSVLKREVDQSLLKKLFYGDYLFQIGQESLFTYTQDFIGSLESSELINFFEQLSVDTMGLSDDYQELIYNIMIEKLNSLPWFSLYESHCETIQNRDPIAMKDKLSKLNSHLSFYNYTTEQIKELNKQIT